MASHYGVGVLPARPYKPRDKAKVEAGVRFAQTYILGRLRRLTFFSLAECNAAITLAMQRMNDRPMRKLGVSRFELFEKIERAALREAGKSNRLDRSGPGKHHSLRSAEADVRWPTSNRNPGRLHIGIGSRLHIGMPGRLRRNPQPTRASEHDQPSFS